MSNKEENSSNNIPNMINSLLERFKSPFAGNFIITWLTMNWRIPYITLFLDQDHTGFPNKLEAVKDVIAKTPIGNLTFYPFAITCVLVFAIPGLNYLAGKFPSYLRFIKSKEDTKMEQELNGLKNQATDLRNELNHLSGLVKNDLLSRIAYNDEKIEKIFPGQWKIFIEYQNRSVDYQTCYIKGNTFVSDNPKLNIITINSIKRNDDKNQKDLIASCVVEATKEEKEYFMDVSNRDEIVFSEKGNRINRIIFNWTYMPSYHP